VEAEQNAKFDKHLSQEEAWIRRGIKARRTRNEGRVRALKALREEHRQRRERAGKANLRLEQAETSGKLVCEAAEVDLSLGGKTLVRGFSTRILRGDRIGIIGPNGVGKTSLIRLLLGEQAPDAGRVRLGTRLETAYFDQQREQLHPATTVMDSVAEGSEKVTIGGRSRHVAGYLRDFLFPAERLHSPVSTLSGGERNRLLLARLLTRPANLLVLDEPTNDLDVETLELLEEQLLEYQGSLILVSHDREFLDNVVTSSLVFEGEGRIGEYVGGYSDWQADLRRREAAARKPAPKPKAHPERKPDRPASKPRKLSYKDQHELESLPAKIEVLEREQFELQTLTSDPAFYQQPAQTITATMAQLEALGRELEDCYERWSELEGMSGE
jgi:ATP-binding cassette subfamily F protein uup